MPKILQPGYEEAIRSKLGVKKSELPDEEINQPLVLNLAEARTIKKVPAYADLVDEEKLLYLQNAVVSYICYLMCPSMPNRLKVEVATIDVKWKKGKTDWDARALEFLAEYEMCLAELEVGYTPTLLGIAKAQGEL